jgi:hypothetical protein
MPKKEVERSHLEREPIGLVAHSVLALLFVIAVLAIAFMIQGGDFFLYRYFAPRYESARRATFEESRAYNEGMAQDLWRMQAEYAQAPFDKRPQLRKIALHRVAGYDASRLPPDLQTFIAELRGQALERSAP